MDADEKESIPPKYFTIATLIIVSWITIEVALYRLSIFPLVAIDIWVPLIMMIWGMWLTEVVVYANHVDKWSTYNTIIQSFAFVPIYFILSYLFSGVFVVPLVTVLVVTIAAVVYIAWLVERGIKSPGIYYETWERERVRGKEERKQIAKHIAIAFHIFWCPQSKCKYGRYFPKVKL